MLKIYDYGDLYHIEIPYKRNKKFKALVDDVKMITGRAWDTSLSVWTVPGSAVAQVRHFANKWKVYIQDPFAASTNFDDMPEMPELDQDIPGFTGTFRPYQAQGVARGLQLKNFIIGDDPGLGKTIQSIGVILAENAFPCVVICPSGLKENWRREWAKFSDKKAMILSDKFKTSWPQYWVAGKVQVFIVNYESLKKYLVQSMPGKDDLARSNQIVMHPFLEKIKGVIIDEIHRCKDPTTIQTKIVGRVALKKKPVVALTGTSVVNSPKDLFSQLAIIGRLQHFANGTCTLGDFKARYCQDGASNTKELKYLLNKHCFFKREKHEVAKDLPAKDRHKFICTLSNMPEYQHAFDNFKDWLKKTGQTEGQIDSKMRAQAITQMMTLKRVSERGKIREIVDFLEDYRINKIKVVLFCTLVATVDEFKANYPEALCITGAQNDSQKQAAVDAFQNDPTRWLVICNVKAAGVGLTLTASSTVVFAGFPWTFADCLQCEDRTHRIGQVNNVNCYYFLAEGTVDEDLYENIQDKKDISNAITGGTDQMHMSIIDRAFNLFNLKNLESYESGNHDTSPAGDDRKELPGIDQPGRTGQALPKSLF